MAKKIGILTGGGDCPGLNPAIRGVVLEALSRGHQCWGLADGWKGMIEGNARPLSREDVEDIVRRGGTILGTSRTNPYKKEGGVQKCLDSLKPNRLLQSEQLLDRNASINILRLPRPAYGPGCFLAPNGDNGRGGPRCIS